MIQSYNSRIKEIIKSITPHDLLEKSHIQEALDWIDSGACLCRTAKPDTPPKHLVSYSIPVDLKKKKLLLVDHRKALLWVPPGGHVDLDEHPKQTASRELQEELEITLPLLMQDPIFFTITQTVGITASHIDVSFWYVFVADSSDTYSYDPREFVQIRWFSFDALPVDRIDPHLIRFCQKLASFL